ncbi:MAG: AMP-dependent synthetase [Deltaproteobacteria bacterium]|nr:MAG: AMP-dependent synthetase [Deltaproteobacteria bacterium]
MSASIPRHPAERGASPPRAATSDHLAMWAQFRPDAEALVDIGTGQRWSWRQLHADSLAWAATLARRSVGPGDRVAVLAANRGDTIALLYAAAHLGAILFPMNIRLSPAELAWQVGHSEPRVLVADAGHLDVAHGLVPDPLSMDAGPRRDLPTPPRARTGNRLGDPWQLMYTSGSSGRPKGALLSHRQVHWNALNTILACDLSPASSTLTFAPLFHTGGMNCLTTPLLHRGGRVVVMPRLDAGEALRCIAEEGITHLMGVPTIYQMLADHPDFARTDLRCVQDAICGGAPLGAALLERYLARGIPLRQGFGLTEVGPNCFSTPPHRVRDKLGTVGMPIHHVEARLIRPDGTPCEVDEPGELLLRGPVVCSGYWRDPEATAAAIDDGWFHTGDVLSMDADGFFTVRGRLKEMYISGGENVYPAEVEAALQTHPDIATAAVIGVPDDRWGEVGMAFIEVVPGRSLDVAALTTWLRGRLARFKIPKHFALTDTLPRTGSGKVDKPALAARAPAGRRPALAPVNAASPTPPEPT